MRLYTLHTHFEWERLQRNQITFELHLENRCRGLTASILWANRAMGSTKGKICGSGLEEKNKKEDG